MKTAPLFIYVVDVKMRTRRETEEGVVLVFVYWGWNAHGVLMISNHVAFLKGFLSLWPKFVAGYKSVTLLKSSYKTGWFESVEAFFPKENH